MKKFPSVIALAVVAFGLLPLCASAGPATGAFYTGTFAGDDDQKVFYFRVATFGAVTIRTWSYAGGVNFAGSTIPAGGFDPTISVFDPQGNVISTTVMVGVAAP